MPDELPRPSIRRGGGYLGGMNIENTLREARGVIGAMLPDATEHDLDVLSSYVGMAWISGPKRPWHEMPDFVKGYLTFYGII